MRLCVYCIISITTVLGCFAFILDSTLMFSIVQEQGNLDSSSSPFTSSKISELLLREAGSIICQTLNAPLSSADIGAKTKVLVMLMSKVSRSERLAVESIIHAISNRLSSPSQVVFLDYTSIILLATTLKSTGYITSTGTSILWPRSWHWKSAFVSNSMAFAAYNALDRVFLGLYCYVMLPTEKWRFSRHPC